MSERVSHYEKINSKKQDLNDIYNKPDPRDYFLKVESLDYVIPDCAKPVFEKIISALTRARGVTVPTLADLGSSYGVNAALLKYGLDLDTLYAHYRNPAMRRASVAETVRSDIAFYRNRPQAMDVNFVGIDIAREAVGYGKAVGLLDDAIAADYETQDVTPTEARLLAGLDMIISTGCVGYVTERSFERILGAAARPAPWIASFVLRIFPYAPIEKVLARNGLVTESLPATFPQRRFAGADERKAAIDAVRALGRDPTGLEAEGRYFATFYLSRPKA